MKYNPLITIGICVYNGERFLKEAIDSALFQTYENLEIIILNDGSIDRTEDIILSYSDIRLKYIKFYANRGIAEGRQTIKSIANGDYLVFLDGDDVFYNDRISYLLNESIKNNSDITSDGYECIDENGLYLCNVSIPEYVSSDIFFTRLIERNRMLPHPLISKKCYKRIDYDISLRYSEDYDFWIKATLNNFIFHKSSEIKLKYRKVKNSLSSDVGSSKEATLKILSKYNIHDFIDIYKKRNFSEGIINYMVTIYYIFTHDYILALEYSKKKWENSEIIDKNFYLATLHLKNGYLKEAKEFMVLHLLKFPNSPAGLNNLGVILGEDKYFVQALALLPTYTDAIENIKNKSNKITFTQINI